MSIPTTSGKFEIINGNLAPDTRTTFVNDVKTLSNGWYTYSFVPVSAGYTSTRYKYYFGHVLETILLTCARFFEVLDGDTLRPARDTGEIHEVMKQKYNGIMIRTPFGLYVAGNSSTNLSDTDFINKFEEAIIIEFSEPPYGCDFISREEYAQVMKDRHRKQFPKRERDGGNENLPQLKNPPPPPPKKTEFPEIKTTPLPPPATLASKKPINEY